MKDKYSRAVETEGGTTIQLSEYVESKLLITLSSVEDGQFLRKEFALSEDEIFTLNSLLNDWTKKRAH
jgi:phage-related protein